MFLHESNIEITKRIEENSVDLIITSPPYYNARDYSQYSSVQNYMDKMKESFIACHRILKPSRMCIINVSPILVKRKNRSKQSYRIPIPFYFVPMMESIGYEFLEDIIWEKPDGSVPNRNGVFYKNRKPVAYKPNIITEYILVFKKKANFLIDKVLKNDSLVLGNYERTNIWKIQPETKGIHPAAFPEKLVENCIKYYSYEGDIVYDPFMGSGTTAVVAEKLNRKWIGSEIHEEFIKLSEKRMEETKKAISLQK